MRSSAQIDFSRRASPRELPELMDGDCSYEDFRDCLRSLETVNRWLLGYRPTLTWLERLPHGLRDPVHIVDVGSGGSDLLRQIAGWARRRGIDLQRSQWSSRMFGWVRWHWLVRHDGPVSFRRAFRKEDWAQLLAAAEVPQEAVTVEQWRPGRLCVGRWK